MKLLFTGGHHNSALVVVDWLLNTENTGFPQNPDIYWIGKRYVGSNKNVTPEYDEISSRNIPFFSITAGKLFRTSSIKYFHLVIINLLKIPIGFLQSLFILYRVRPDLIVSFGGYIALPVVLSGKVLGIKSVTHEQTAVIGLANKIVIRYVENVYTTWPVDRYPEYNDKYIQVGLPISKKIIDTNVHQKYQFSKNMPVIYVSGGKLGSEFINNIIIESLLKLINVSNVIWSTGVGKKYSEVMYKIGPIIDSNDNSLIVKEYFGENDISMVFNTANIFIGRGGAHTLYEIALAKKSAVIIPIPWSSNNEQLKNAKQLEKSGLGIVLDQEGLTPDIFFKSIINRIEYSQSNEFRNIDISKMGIINNADERLGNEIIKKIKKEKKA